MKHLSKFEIKSLLSKVPKEWQRLMLLVTYYHGLRISETLSLEKEDIRDGFISVQRLKGSLKTVQPYIINDDPELDESKRLSELYHILKPKEKLFPITRFGVHKLIQSAGSKAGIPKHLLHAHALKHSIAMQTIHTAGIENVRQWLGHRSIASTGEYLRVSDEEAAKHVAAAMRI